MMGPTVRDKMEEGVVGRAADIRDAEVRGIPGRKRMQCGAEEVENQDEMEESEESEGV